MPWWRKESFKTKTTKLDKTNRSESNPSQSIICEGPDFSADDLLPIHLRGYAMQSFKDLTDWYVGDCRGRIGDVSKVDCRYPSH